MGKIVSVIILAAFLFCCAPAMAADKVVVVPLSSSSAKGSDQQLQYNDNGKTAGAELYYDKMNRRLEARGEVRTTDGSGNPRLWGRGRPGTALLTHTEACPNLLASTRFALSKHLVTWEGAAEACPVGTWVCTSAELPSSGTCNIQQGSYVYQRGCDGTKLSGNDLTSLTGWVSDITPSNAGVVVPSHSLLNRGADDSCISYRVWCCWKSSVSFPPLP